MDDTMIAHICLVCSVFVHQSTSMYVAPYALVRHQHPSFREWKPTNINWLQEITVKCVRNCDSLIYRAALSFGWETFSICDTSVERWKGIHSWKTRRKRMYSECFKLRVQMRQSTNTIWGYKRTVDGKPRLQLEFHKIISQNMIISFSFRKWLSRFHFSFAFWLTKTHWFSSFSFFIELFIAIAKTTVLGND